MNVRNPSFFALCVLAACGPSSPPAGTGPTGTDEQGTVFTEFGKVGYLLNTDGSDPPVMAEFDERGIAYDATRIDGVWISTAEQNFYGMDVFGSDLRGPFTLPAGITELGSVAITEFEVWFGVTGSNEGVGPLVFDTTSETTTVLSADPDFGGGAPIFSIDTDGDSVFALQSFNLLRYDVASHERRAGAFLGENPSNPTGPRGDFGGRGEVAVGDDHVWVLDESVFKLLQIDKVDLTVEAIIDLNPLVPVDETIANVNMVVGDERVYISAGDDNGTIIAVDKATATPSELHVAGEQIVASLGIKQDVLLIDDPVGALIVDGLTGEQIGTTRASLTTDGPTIWVECPAGHVCF